MKLLDDEGVNQVPWDVYNNISEHMSQDVLSFVFFSLATVILWKVFGLVDDFETVIVIDYNGAHKLKQMNS